MTLNDLLGNYKGDVEFKDVTGIPVAKCHSDEPGNLPILNYIGEIEVVSWQAIQSTKHPGIVVHCVFIEDPVSV